MLDDLVRSWLLTYLPRRVLGHTEHIALEMAGVRFLRMIGVRIQCLRLRDRVSSGTAGGTPCSPAVSAKPLI